MDTEPEFPTAAQRVVNRIINAERLDPILVGQVLRVEGQPQALHWPNIELEIEVMFRAEIPIRFGRCAEGAGERPTSTSII